MRKVPLAWLVGVLPAVAIVHALLVWRSLGGDAWPWIVNDLAYHLYVPFLLPAGLAAMFATKPWSLLASLKGSQRSFWIAVLALCMLVGLAGGYQDVSTRFYEPYFHQDVAPLVSIQNDVRERLKKSWRRGDSEEQLGDIRAAGREAYDAALNQNRRWSAADIAHSAITLLTSMLIGAAFWVVALSFFVGFRMKKEGKRVPARAADAMTLAAGLLILWFPTRLYTEWHLHFYSLDKLAEFQMFWVMLFVAAAALLLLVLLRFSRSFQTSLSAVCAAGSAATGIVALIKPEALWYVWQVIGDMAAIPWAILVIVTAFTSVLIARMAHADA